MSGFKADRWSGNAQLWWTGAKIGDRLIADFEVTTEAKFLHVVLTKARNYGVVKLLVDDKVIAEKIDLYSTDVRTTGVLSYDASNLKSGKHTLSLEIVGTNPQSLPAHMVGIDYLRLTNDPIPLKPQHLPITIRRLLV